MVQTSDAEHTAAPEEHCLVSLNSYNIHCSKHNVEVLYLEYESVLASFERNETTIMEIVKYLISICTAVCVSEFACVCDNSTYEMSGNLKI